MKFTNSAFRVLSLSLSILSSGCLQPEKKENATTPVVNEYVVPAQKPADELVLIGTWERTDAPYQIVISDALKDSTLKAEYLNPKSIHVEKAQWKFFDDNLNIYVEMRDVNYPGSNYTLIYYPDRDLLAGKYFQAIEKTTYDVGFMRKK